MTPVLKLGFCPPIDQPRALARRTPCERTGLPRLKGPGAGIPRHCVAGSCWCAAATDRNSTVRLKQRVKRFPFQQFVSKQYKRRSRWSHSPYGEQWLDKQSLHTNTTQPLPDALGRELSRESLRI